MEEEITELRAAVLAMHTQLLALQQAVHHTAPLAIAMYYVLMGDPAYAPYITALLMRFHHDLLVMARRQMAVPNRKRKHRD